ncbi:FAD-binding domain-containing protein [Apiospora marii]|uniref:FAD-binding domain-containing protein n=1 Tax=Apiospora marii TaxID=335849 RepID=A0ABR1R653_9PEZI
MYHTSRCHIVRIACTLVALACALPNSTDWTSLSQDLGPKLRPGRPLAAACFAVIDGKPCSKAAAACKEVMAKCFNDTYRSSKYTGFFHNYNQACYANATDHCLLPQIDGITLTGEFTGACNQGLVSPYCVDVWPPKGRAEGPQFRAVWGPRRAARDAGRVRRAPRRPHGGLVSAGLERRQHGHVPRVQAISLAFKRRSEL